MEVTTRDAMGYYNNNEECSRREVTLHTYSNGYIITPIIIIIINTS